MAAIMSVTYPELYAATGIHSVFLMGPPPTWFRLSRHARRTGFRAPKASARRRDRANHHVRTIIFHGASDQTVHPSNAEMILAEARAGLAHPRGKRNMTASRRALLYAPRDRRREWRAPCGALDHRRLGHAWSGATRRFIHRPQWPDASREMLRFFEGGGAQPSKR